MTTTTVYADTSDGKIISEDATYSTCRAGAALSQTTNATADRVGQLTGYECHELFFRFDTSSIPDTDTVDSAVFSLDGNTDASTTDFTMEARASAWGATLTTADWVAGADLGALTLLASLSTASYSAGYMDFTSDAAFPANVSKTGYTELLVCSSRHRVGTAPTGNEYVVVTMADTAGTTTDPKLVVVHSVAAVNATVTPGVIAAVAALPATGLSAGSTVTPGVIANTVGVPQALALELQIVTPATIAALTAFPAASPSAGSTVTPAVLAALAAFPQASPSASSTVSPGLISSLISVLQATPAAGADATPATIATVVSVLQALAYAVMKGRAFGGDAAAFLTAGADSLANRGHGTDAAAYPATGRDTPTQRGHGTDAPAYPTEGRDS
jgi:hypothetical protein